jgi:hypothetical protein
MLECLIMGDSIAVGTAKYATHCVTAAKGGISSKTFATSLANHMVTELGYRIVVISLGSNDEHTFPEHLIKVRERVSNSDKVFWILPSRNADVVQQVAAKYGDGTLERPLLSKDKIHPTEAGYKVLAKSTHLR